jgi:uncharacterized protein YaaW (UPF0174 family)
MVMTPKMMQNLMLLIIHNKLNYMEVAEEAEVVHPLT